MTDRQIRDEMLALFSAGYETIGDGLGWTWYLLSQHPEVEARFLAELREVLGGRVPCADDVAKLRYTGMILAESMRLYPPTWIFIRIARQDETLPSGATIPAGAKLYLCQYVMHRNPRYWPIQSGSTRSDSASQRKKNDTSWRIFRRGRCPGLYWRIIRQNGRSLRVLVLAAIAQRCAFTLMPGQTIVPKPQMTLRPKNGICEWNAVKGYAVNQW